MDSKPIVIDQLLGEDQRWTAGQAQADSAVDMWFDPRAGWQSSGGYRRIIVGPTLGQPPATVNPFRAIGPIESIHRVSRHNGACADLIYIDGDHEFGPALEDIRNALRFPDAVILGDDFAPDLPGVRAAVLQAAWESLEMLRVVGRCWRMR